MKSERENIGKMLSPRQQAKLLIMHKRMRSYEKREPGASAHQGN